MDDRQDAAHLAGRTVEHWHIMLDEDDPAAGRRDMAQHLHAVVNDSPDVAAPPARALARRKRARARHQRRLASSRDPATPDPA